MRNSYNTRFMALKSSAVGTAADYFCSSEAEGRKSSFIILQTIHPFAKNLKLFQMQVALSPNTIPL